MHFNVDGIEDVHFTYLKKRKLGKQGYWKSIFDVFKEHKLSKNVYWLLESLVL